MVDATPGSICRLKANANSGKTPGGWADAQKPRYGIPPVQQPFSDCWADQSEMVVLFGTLLMWMEWLTKPCTTATPSARQFVLDTGGSPRQWTNLCTPFASPHPRATIPIPVLTRS